MATPAGRPGYSAWLDEIGRQGRTDEPGLVASAWLAAQANGRPRLSAVRSVNKWLADHGVPGVTNINAALHALEQAYHTPEGLPAAQEPGQPAAPPPVAFQPPLYGVPAGQGPAPSPQQAAQPDQAQQQPVPPAAPMQQPAHVAAGQTAVPEHPWQVIMLALGRIEAALAWWGEHLAPLAQLAAEAGAVNAALDASGLTQPSEAQQRVQAIAAEHGWTQGPAFADEAAGQEPVPDFYGNHVVPPDFAAMAAESDGTEDGAE